MSEFNWQELEDKYSEYESTNRVSMDSIYKVNQVEYRVYLSV